MEVSWNDKRNVKPLIPLLLLTKDDDAKYLWFISNAIKKAYQGEQMIQ